MHFQSVQQIHANNQIKYVLPVCEGEGEDSEDPAVEEGDDGEDEGPPDAAVAEAVVGRVGPADAAHVVVVPPRRERQDPDGQADPWKRERAELGMRQRDIYMYTSSGLPRYLMIALL